MKRFIFLVFVFFLRLVGYCQKDSTFPFNEFNLSINNVKSLNSQFVFSPGFGLGVYRSVGNQKMINGVFGFEWNKARQLVKHVYQGPFSYAEDVVYSIDALSIPIAARINFGKKTKAFFEPGFFLDLYVGGRSKGTSYTYLPGQSATKKEFDGKSGGNGVNYGPSAGIGIKIPFNKNELIAKMDYKLGMVWYGDYMDKISWQYLRFSIGARIVKFHALGKLP